MKKRYQEIDILKGIAIILMVAAHCGAPFTRFAFLFHMAAFFMASGFCYREKTAESLRSVGKNILRKIKTLWVPFFIWNTVFVLLRNGLIRINIYTDNPLVEQYGGHVTEAYTAGDMLRRIAGGALFSYKEEIIGALWFLKILFLLSLAFCVMDFLVKRVTRGSRTARLLVHLGLSGVFLGLGYWGSVRDEQLFGISYVGSYYCLFYLGHCLSLLREKMKNWHWTVWVLILLLSYGALKLLQPLGGIGLNQNKYGSPFFLLATSVSGWCFLYSFSSLLSRIPVIGTGVAFVGRHTMPVVIFHFLAYKLVACLIVILRHLPAYCIAVFTCLDGGGAWWMVYTIVGTAVPILLGLLYQSVRKHVSWNRRKMVNELHE